VKLNERAASLQNPGSFVAFGPGLSYLHDMRFLHQVRTLRGWSRALLVSLALAFGVASVAHAAHRHDLATTASTLHSVACGYCVTFGGLATAPSHRLPNLAPRIDAFDIAVDIAAPASRRQHSPAQPRAPPLLP
jgi:hypothetical protein